MPGAEVETRDARLDALKGVAIVLVLLWHLQPFAGLGRFWRLTWVFNWQISLLGVPVLFLVSLYLFDRRASRGPSYAAKRLGRIGVLLVIWGVLQSIAYVLIVHRLPAVQISLLYMGGPALPTVGDSVFYFLFDLLLLTGASYLYLRLPARVRALVGVTVVIASLLYFEACALGLLGDIPYFSLLNFVVYIPIAAWLASHSRSCVRLRLPLACAWVVLLVHDVVLRGPIPHSLQLSSFSYYGRDSLVAGATLLLVATLSAKPRPMPALETVGRYSLGLFAVHKYAWYAIATGLGGSFLAGHAKSGPILVAVLTVAVSAAVVWLVLLTPLYTLVGGISKMKFGGRAGYDGHEGTALDVESDPLPPF